MRLWPKARSITTPTYGGSCRESNQYAVAAEHSATAQQTGRGKPLGAVVAADAAVVAADAAVVTADAAVVAADGAVVAADAAVVTADAAVVTADGGSRGGVEVRRL